MYRRNIVRAFAPWSPPARADTKTTVPPPIAAEVGGMAGYSVSYSERLVSTPYWRRMAESTIAQRYQENETTYPMSPVNRKEYDMRYLPLCEPDPLTHEPLVYLGENANIPTLPVPVIFLVDVQHPTKSFFYGRKYETRWVSPNFMREELHPNRLAVYATMANYKLLGLPPVDHRIHEWIPKSFEGLDKLMSKRVWSEEPWRYSFEWMFRGVNENDGVPLELLDDPAEADALAEEDMQVVTSADGTAVSAKGAVKKRKARKVKLF